MGYNTHVVHLIELNVKYKSCRMKSHKIEINL